MITKFKVGDCVKFDSLEYAFYTVLTKVNSTRWYGYWKAYNLDGNNHLTWNPGGNWIYPNNTGRYKTIKIDVPEDIKEFVNKAFQSNDQNAMSYAEELIKQYDNGV